MLIPLLKGFATWIPGFEIHRWRRLSATPATYYYAVWLRHLVLAHQHGLAPAIDVVAELGPGGALGIGLAALLSGANGYYALDIVEHGNTRRNLEILDDLVALLTARADIPGERAFPGLRPHLRSYGFPHHILGDALLQRALQPARVAAIRCSLQGQHSD